MKIKSHARFLRKRSAVAVSRHWVQGQADGWRSRVASTLGIWQLDAACAAVVHPAHFAHTTLTGFHTRIAKVAVQLRGYVDLARSPAGACVQKRVQSRAYAPPQGPLTRCPPITRHTNITVAAAHTLTRVAGAKPPRHGPSLHTAKTGDEAHHCGDYRPLSFGAHLARRLPARWPPGSAQFTQRHARTSS